MSRASHTSPMPPAPRRERAWAYCSSASRIVSTAERSAPRSFSTTAGYGLPDDLDVLQAPGPDELVPIEPLPASRGVAPDRLNRLQDVTETVEVPYHRATASWSTRSRKRGRRPRALTTSTRHPRRSCTSATKPPRSKRLRPCSRSTRRWCGRIFPNPTLHSRRSQAADRLATRVRDRSALCGCVRVPRKVELLGRC